MIDQSVIEKENPEEYKKKLKLAETLVELTVKEKEIQSSKGFGKAYFWSFIMPPMGVYYFFKYLFFSGGSREDIQAGIVSLVLTLISILVSLWSLSALLNQTSSLLPGQNLELLKNVVSPENQKQILDLYK